MRAIATLAALGLLAAAAAGCVSTVPGAELSEGTVVFSAEAVSVVAKEGDPLALIEATGAAGVMAEAKLLGKIKGEFISSRVGVGDLMFEGQEAAATVEGHLARATVTYATESEGSGTTTVRATAVLELSRGDLERLYEYVE